MLSELSNKLSLWTLTLISVFSFLSCGKVVPLITSLYERKDIPNFHPNPYQYPVCTRKGPLLTSCFVYVDITEYYIFTLNCLFPLPVILDWCISFCFCDQLEKNVLQRYLSHSKYLSTSPRRVIHVIYMYYPRDKHVLSTFLQPHIHLTTLHIYNCQVLLYCIDYIYSYVILN